MGPAATKREREGWHMLVKTNIGTHPDTGRPLHHYAQVDSDRPVVFVGPHISGVVTLPDGTVYDVTEDVIEVAHGHADAVAHAIGVWHETEGHPLHAPTVTDPDPQPFVHTCTDVCGDAADDDRRVPVVERLRAMGREV